MENGSRMFTTLGFLLLVLVALYVILMLFAPAVQAPENAFRERAERAPTPTPESARIAAAPQSFQYLVSFTPRGFEPRNLTVEKGGTVRFVNNTQNDLYFVADASLISPQTIGPRSYIEVTFDEAGEYPYSDKETKRAGVVEVE